MDRLYFRNTGRSLLSLGRFFSRSLLGYSLLVILPALLLLGPANSAFANFTIKVYANQVQGYINPLVFGQNVFFGGNYLWDHQEDEITRMVDATNVPENTVKARIEALAPTILRFPGGTAADLYLWEDGLGFGNLNG